MIATLKRSLWVGGIVAITLGVIMALMVTTMSVANAKNEHENNGKFQPVWCHLTGSGWKAQLGAEPSGGRHEAFALLMTDEIRDLNLDIIDNNVDDGEQVMAHDRSSKLLADLCEKQAPELARDASASVSVNPATCENGEQLVYGTPVFARFSDESTPDGTYGPTKYKVTAIADQGHLFIVNGKDELTLKGKLSAKLLCDAVATVKIMPSTCLVAEQLQYDVHTFSKFASGTADGIYGPGDFSVTAKAKKGHFFADGEKTLVLSGTLADKKPAQSTDPEGDCYTPPTQEGVATATVKIVPATCKVGETLMYAEVSNASATAESTKDGATGPLHYSVTFVANDGSKFADEAKTTFEGDLQGPSTAPSCEEGDVLGETTNGGGKTPTQLPETAGEATAAIALGGSLLLVIAGLAGARRFLTRGL